VHKSHAFPPVCQLHSLVSLANLLRVHSIPLSMSPTKILNIVGPITDHLRNTTRHCSPLGHRAINCSTLSATIQQTSYPQSGPSVKCMYLQFRDKDVMWHCIKCSAQVQVDDIICLFLIHQYSNAILEGQQVCQAWFAHSEAMLAVTNHLLVFRVP